MISLTNSPKTTVLLRVQEGSTPYVFTLFQSVLRRKETRMAKEGTVPSIVLDGLRDKYLEMKLAKSQVATQVRERYRKQIQDAIERETQMIERLFAVQFVEVRNQGATRRELVNVIGDGTAATYRKFMELGGGDMRKLTTGSERLSARAENAGIIRVEDNLFDITLSTGDVVTVYLAWVEGKPAIWSDDRDTMMKMREEFKSGAGLYRKGAEITSLFGLEES